MAEQQQPQSSSSGTNGAGGRPSNRSPSTAGDKNGGGTSAAKKAKNKRNNDRKKKNNQQKKGAAQKATFAGGVTDTTDHLFGYVIDPSATTNMANQCRKLVNQIKLHCTNKQIYKLVASINNGVILERDDFLSPMPSSASYATRSTDADGNVKLIINNPEKKEELTVLWNKTVNSEITEWTKYESFYKSLFITVVGQLHDKVLSTCKLDKIRWTTIEQDLDLVALLKMLEMVCNQNSAGNRVFMPANNLITIDKCLNYKQRDSVSNMEFVKEVNTMYTSVIHQNGDFAFGTSYYDNVMARQSGTFITYLALSAANKIPIDKEVQELIVSMLVMKGCNHNRARNELTTQYSLGTITDATYPATEEAVITLLNSVKRGNDSNNKAAAAAATGGDDDTAILAAHEIEYISDGDDYYDEESAYEEESVESTEEADEATLMASSVEGEANADTKTGDGDAFMATILANAAAAYDEGVESIENNFINRIDNQQDIEDAFDDNEPEIIVAVHSAELVDEDDNGDFVIIEDNNDINNNGMNVNNNNTIELLNATSSDEDDSNHGLEINNDNNVQAAADTGTSNNGVNLLLIQPTESQKHNVLKVSRDIITAVFAASTTIINRKFASKAQDPTINHIIDYADALLCKLRDINITTATELHNAINVII